MEIRLDVGLDDIVVTAFEEKTVRSFAVGLGDNVSESAALGAPLIAQMVWLTAVVVGTDPQQNW